MVRTKKDWGIDLTEVINELVGEDAPYSTKQALITDMIGHLQNYIDIAYAVSVLGATPDATVKGRGGVQISTDII